MKFSWSWRFKMIKGEGNRKRRCKSCDVKIPACEGLICGVNFVCSIKCAYQLGKKQIDKQKVEGLRNWSCNVAKVSTHAKVLCVMVFGSSVHIRITRLLMDDLPLIPITIPPEFAKLITDCIILDLEAVNLSTKECGTLDGTTLKPFLSHKRN